MSVFTLFSSFKSISTFIPHTKLQTNQKMDLKGDARQETKTI